MSTSVFPIWARVVSVLLFLWSLVGLWAFYSQVSMSPEMMAQLPAGEQQIWAAMPPWLWWIYGVAVGSAFVGAVLLLWRRAVARPFYLLSLIAVVIQFGYVFAATPIFSLVGPSSVLFPGFIILVAMFTLWLVSTWIRKAWLS